MDQAVLQCASWLVPRQQRREWLAEWRSELWYVRRSCVWEPADGAGEGDTAMAFCLGAFKDALWLRRNSPREPGRYAIRLESAQQCGCLLALLAVATIITAVRLPGARDAIEGKRASNSDRVVLISRDDAADTKVPSVSIGEYEAWKIRKQSLFSEFAFFRPFFDKVPISARRKAGLTVALSSDNLFDVLNIPLSSTLLDEAKAEHRPALALSERAWRSYFNADSSLVGQSLDVGGQKAIVAAILPDGAWPLPVPADAWLLEEGAYVNALPAQSNGFVLGRFAQAAPASDDPRGWHLSVARREDTGYDGFDLAPVYEQVERPTATFLFTLLLACLALPATTPLPLGDYPATDASLTRATRRRRWLFLLMKIGCILPIVYFGSISLAFYNPSIRPAPSEYIQFATSFLALLFSFRWALRDQRRRCPVCLRVLTHPARVGHPSRNFLAWHGTEFMCDQGHGLLHVPELATTWFSTQRWLYLDASWKGLFPEPYLPPASVF